MEEGWEGWEEEFKEVSHSKTHDFNFTQGPVAINFKRAVPPYTKYWALNVKEQNLRGLLNTQVLFTSAIFDTDSSDYWHLAAWFLGAAFFHDS